MKALLIILLIIVITPYLLRLAFPFILKWLAKRMQTGQHQDSQSGKEGEIKVEVKEKNSSAQDNGLGEYIDFEEIDEN